MISLFLDTSDSIMTLGLFKNNKLINKISLDIPRSHSIYAVEKIKELLDTSSVKKEDLYKIFVVNGPGSFTGVRIGVTIAKTIAYSLNIPIVPISSLKLKIFDYKKADYYVAIIKDKRNLSFVGIYDNSYETMFEGLITELELDEKLKSLSGIIKIIEEYTLNFEEMIKYFDKTSSVNPHNLNPVYLKEVV